MASAVLTRQALQDLVAHGAANDKRLVGAARSRRLIDHPPRTPHETEVLPKILAELREAAEWDPMPETAPTPGLETPLMHGASDRTVRRSIVRQFSLGRVHNAEALESSPLPALRVRRDA